MRIWALVSQKGGAGKSMLATQLAVYGGQLGEKVVILDLDPQASAWKWHEIRGEGTAPAVIRVLPDNLMKVVGALRESELATLVLIDTAPHTNKGAVEAIRACDLIICPTKPGVLDLSALVDTVTLLDLASAKDRALGVVNSVHGQGAAKAYARACAVVERFGIRVAGAYVGDRVAFQHASDAGKGVTEVGKSHDAAADIQKLWAELNETWPVVIVNYRRLKATASESI